MAAVLNGRSDQRRVVELMTRVLDDRPLQYARDLLQLNGSRNYHDLHINDTVSRTRIFDFLQAKILGRIKYYGNTANFK